MADKDIDGMLRAMLLVARRVIFTQAENERAAATSLLLERSLEIGGQAAKGLVTLASSIALAVHVALDGASPDDIICVAGSLSVAGEARRVLRQAHLAPHPH